MKGGWREVSGKTNETRFMMGPGSAGASSPPRTLLTCLPTRPLPGVFRLLTVAYTVQQLRILPSTCSTCSTLWSFRGPVMRYALLDPSCIAATDGVISSQLDAYDNLRCLWRDDLNRYVQLPLFLSCTLDLRLIICAIEHSKLERRAPQHSNIYPSPTMSSATFGAVRRSEQLKTLFLTHLKSRGFRAVWGVGTAQAMIPNLKLEDRLRTPQLRISLSRIFLDPLKSSATTLASLVQVPEPMLGTES